MAKKEYMPRADKDKLTWLKNFASKIQAYALTLKIPDSEIQSISADATAFGYVLECVEMVKTYNQQMISFKDALRDGTSKQGASEMPMALVFPNPPPMVEEGIFNRIRRVVQNIKSQKAYTDDIGKALGIIGESSTTDFHSLQPQLSAILSGGKVVVKWKKGDADSINVYVRRGVGDFVFAGNDAKPPFDDPSPLPSEPTTWTYKAMYVVKDIEVGQMSQEVSILVQKLF